MTDKELIKQEIESTLNGLFDYIPSASKVLYNDFTKDEAVVLGKYKALEDILKFLDSLPEEPASEDLEEEIKNYIQKEYPDGMGFPNVPKIARHFAEWQKQRDFPAKDITDSTMYWCGYRDCKEEMMKDAISCNVGWYDGFILDYTQEQQDDILLKLGADVGDKVKIIIVKED